MRITELVVDTDPWPRTAPVGPGSAYSAVTVAVPATVETISVRSGGGAMHPRGEQVLRTWQFTPAAEGEWRTVAVPHVWSRAEADLADHRGPCWYRRELPATDDGHHRLVLPALDYVATVTVDGVVLGHHEGGFTPVAFDVPSGAATVTVEIDDPVEEALIGDHPLTDPKRKIKGVQEFHDSRPGGHSHGVWFGPTWGRRWGTGGMVEPPRLVSTGPVRLDATFVTATPDRIALNWVVTNHGASDATITITAAINGGPTVQVAAVAPPGPSRVAVTGAVADATLWEPTTGAGHRAHVYRVHSTVAVDGSVSDSGTTSFGVREIVMPLEPDNQFQLHVNGRRTYVRAVNYIPGVWMSELTEATFAADLDLATHANTNSVGLHALVLPDRFYDVADRTGTLVYQDFPLNLANDPGGAPLFDGGPTNGEACSLLAAELTYHLYNRPSVVYWCGHNEPAYQLGEVFGGANHPDLIDIRDRLVGAPNEEDLDDARVAQWNHMDPTRPAYKASGLGRHRPVGDSHTYSGSLSTDPTTTIASTEATFMSEFGGWTADFCAEAVAPGARGDWPAGDDVVPDWEHRTHMWFSNALRAGRHERHTDFATWTYASQLWCGAFLKIGIESYRRRMWNPFGGHRYHLFVDHYGEAGAGMVDKHRLAQAHYWALADAHRLVLPAVAQPPSMRVAPGESIELPTWLVNDTPSALSDVVLRWSIAELADDEAFIIGTDDPRIAHRFGVPEPPVGDLVVLPRAEGRVVATGDGDVSVDGDNAATGPSVSWTAPSVADPTPFIVRIEAAGVTNWGAFVVAPSDWVPDPGITPTPRFRLGLPDDVRVTRRWAGTAVDPERYNALEPGQYVVHFRNRVLPVDLYGDVTVDVSAETATAGSSLPWPWDPTFRVWIN